MVSFVRKRDPLPDMEVREGSRLQPSLPPVVEQPPVICGILVKRLSI